MSGGVRVRRHQRSFYVRAIRMDKPVGRIVWAKNRDLARKQFESDTGIPRRQIILVHEKE